MLTVSYSVNNNIITREALRTIKIEKKDYIDYIETLKNKTAQINHNKNITKTYEACWQTL